MPKRRSTSCQTHSYLFLLLICLFHPALSQDSPKSDGLWDLRSLEKAPPFSWLEKSGPVRSIRYQSTDFEGKPTEVFAYYATPETLLGKPASGKKFPGLVLVHGGGGTAFKEWGEKWAAEGYAAVAMDLSGRDGNGKKLKNAGPGQTHEDKFSKIEKSPLTDVWTYHAVASIVLAHSWLLERPEVDPLKTGITGISWGGYLTTIAGSVDARFQAAVPVYGCGYYNESDVFSPSVRALSVTGQKKWMAYFDPSVYLGKSSIPFLFLNGNKDKFYNVVPYDKTYRLVSPKNRKVLIIPDMKHSHYHGWEPHEIKYFFDQILLDKAPLADIFSPETSGERITVSYSSPVSLYTAEFHFSSDVTSSNETRVWSVQKADIDPVSGKISTPIPANGFKYGFFYVVDNRNVSASSEFLINN